MNNIKGITVEIGGDVGPLNNALKGVNKTSRDLQNELREINKELKFNPSNTELLTQKQTVLAKQIANTKEKLTALKEAQEQVEEQFQNGEIGEEKYRALQREIIKTESQLKNLEDQAKGTASTLSQGFTNAGTKLKEVGGKVTNAGKKMMPVTAGIVGVGVAAGVAWKEVDDSLDTIATKTGATGQQMEGLEQSFKNIYKSIPTDAQAAGDAIGEVNTQFGLTGKALEDASSQMVKFGSINNTDVTTSTQNAKGAIEAFGLSTKDLGGVLDAVTATSQKTGVGVDQLFDSVIKGAPTLKNLGLNFSEATELMGRFEKGGIDGQKALSYLSKSSVEFAKEGKSVSEGLTEVSTKIKNSKTDTEALTIATKYFGTKGAVFMVDAIKRGTLDLNGLSDSAKKAGGSVSKTFDATLDPIDKAKTALNNLKLVGADLASSLQSVLAPMLQELVKKLQEFSKWFSDLSPKTKDIIIKTGLIAAAIGPVLITTGKIITAVGSISNGIGRMIDVVGSLHGWLAEKIPQAISFLMANPMVLWIAGITAAVALLVVGIKHLWETNEGFRTAVTNIWNGIKSFFAGIPAFFAGIWNTIKTGISTGWNGFKNIIVTVCNGIKTGVVTVWNGIINWFKNLPKTLFNIGKNMFISMKEGISNILPTVGTAIKTGMTKAISFLKNLPSQFLQYGKDMIQNLVNGIKSMVGKVGEAAKSVAKKIWSFLHFSVPEEGPLSDADTYGTDFMQLLADTIEKSSDKPEEAAKNVANLVSKRIQEVKNDLAKGVNDLNLELSKLDDAEKKALNGANSTSQSTIREEYDKKKQVINDEIELRKKQADKEIAEIQRIGKMSKEELGKELEARKQFVSDVNSLNDQIKNALKEKYTEAQKAEEDNLNKQLDDWEDWKDKSEDAINDLFDTKQDRLEADEKAAEEAIQAELDELGKWKDASIQNIEDVANAKVEAIQKQIDALEEQTAAEDRAEKHKEYEDKIADLQEQMKYSHDDYNTSQLQKQIQSEQAEYQKLLDKEAVDDKKTELEKQIDIIQNDADNQKKAIEDIYDAKKSRLNKQLDESKAYYAKQKELMNADKEAQLANISQIYTANKTSLDQQLIDVQTFYTQKLTDAQLEAESEQLIMDNNQQAIIELLNSYGEQYKQAGETLGERLVEGFQPKIDEIKDMISSITADISSARDEALRTMESNSISSSKTVSNTSNKTVNNFNFTHNSPTKASPSEQRRQDESLFRKAAFLI